MAIDNSKDFGNWLKKQSKETCILIAARAALRVFPVVTQTELALVTARALLTSGIAGKMPTPDVDAAARAASSATRTADPAVYADVISTNRAAPDLASGAAAYTVRAAVHADDAAAYSVKAADAAARAAFAAAFAATFSNDSVGAAVRDGNAVTADAVARAASYADADIPLELLVEIPLWAESREPDWLVSGLILRNNLFDSDPEWSFWREWYHSFLIGEPMDWELQRRVALIEDAIWDAGPEAVAEEIERIRAQWLAEKTAIGPDAVYSEAKQRFELEYRISNATDSVEFVVERVEMAVANAIEAGRGNGLTDKSIEVVSLRRTIENHRGDASQLATAFHDARGALEHNLECGMYPKDASLLILSNTLFANKEELCENDPLARERCDRLDKLAPPKPVPELDRDAVLQAPNELAGIVDEDFKEQLELAAGQIATSDKPPKSVVARFTNWITTIQLSVDKVQTNEKRAAFLAGLVRRLIEWWPF